MSQTPERHSPPPSLLALFRGERAGRCLKDLGGGGAHMPFWRLPQEDGGRGRQGAEEAEKGEGRKESQEMTGDQDEAV